MADLSTSAVKDLFTGFEVGMINPESGQARKAHSCIVAIGAVLTRLLQCHRCLGLGGDVRLVRLVLGLAAG
jgi:hypothetical protein